MNKVKFWIDRIHFFLSFVPFLTLILYITLAFHANFLLGKWTVVFKDNPHSLLFDMHDYITCLSIFSLFIVFPLWVVFLVILFLTKGRVLVFVKRFLIFMFSFLVLFIVWHYDPTNFSEWFFD